MNLPFPLAGPDVAKSEIVCRVVILYFKVEIRMTNNRLVRPVVYIT